jgi:hypothetical protein
MEPSELIEFLESMVKQIIQNVAWLAIELATTACQQLSYYLETWLTLLRDLLQAFEKFILDLVAISAPIDVELT